MWIFDSQDDIRRMNAIRAQPRSLAGGTPISIFTELLEGGCRAGK
jgi:hypothetical protein